MPLFAGVGTLGKFLGRDFLDLGVELLFEEGEGVVDIELVDNLLDILAVLGNGAGGLLETFVLLLLVLTFLEGVGLAEDAIDVVDNVVLGGFDVLDLVKSAVDKLPLERGEIFIGPVLLNALGSEVFVTTRENPTFEEGLGDGGIEIVDELLADLVDKENLALLVVGLFNLGREGFAELVNIVDVLAGEDLLEELKPFIIG